MDKEASMFVTKAINKVCRTLARTPVGGGLFRVDAAASSRNHVALPPADEARELLMGLSPRPASSWRTWRYSNAASVDLTVVIPCYNVEDYIGECLESVLSQVVDFSMEVVVVNDGSTDGTLGEIERAAGGDARVVLIDQENKGFSGARNAGIDVARGRALAFVDADDKCAPGTLRELMDKYRASGCDYVSGLYSKISDAGEPLGLGQSVRTHGAPWGRVFSREVWADLRFPEGYWFEDTVYAYCIRPRYSEALSSNAGYLYRVRPGSISHTANRSYKGIDSYWVVEELVDWCRNLGIPLGQELYDQTLQQFGPLLLSRAAKLSADELVALFALCCDFMARTREFDGMTTALGGRWAAVERALRTRDYGLWRAACRWV